MNSPPSAEGVCPPIDATLPTVVTAGQMYDLSELILDSYIYTRLPPGRLPHSSSILITSTFLATPRNTVLKLSTSPIVVSIE